MLTLPAEIMVILQPFAPVFSERIWDWVQVLLVGAILSPRQRTVSAALRIVGLGQERQFQNYHRVLNRARWSGLEASRLLLKLLVTTFVAGDAALYLAADETLERRRGDKISSKGFFRDPVLSSQQKNVVSSGVRWVSLMLLVKVPWNQRLWALPFLTLQALHPETSAALGKRHKTSLDWVRQMTGLVRRWQPEREIVLLTDGALISVKLGLRCTHYRLPVTFISRLHLNICLYDPPQSRPAGKRGASAPVGQRQPNLQAILQDEHTAWKRQALAWYGAKTRLVEWVSGTALWRTTSEKQPLPLRWVLVRDPAGKFKSAAFCCTDCHLPPEQIIALYVLRWNVEVTFQEARLHLGIETQRQWNALAIARTTPLLLALFSLVVLLAFFLTDGQPLPTRRTAWYSKSEATFVDVLAYVRFYLWQHLRFPNPLSNQRFQQFPPSAFLLLVETLCYSP